MEINGVSYQSDPNFTNVTESILNLTDRSLHLNESHPIGILRNIIEHRFNSLPGSHFATFNHFKPIVTKWQNFDSLGFPKDHPGRSVSDTYYINGETLLRTHTSAHEQECFHSIKENNEEAFLISADVYRRDEIDRTHYPVFHQMEGAHLWGRSSEELHHLEKSIKELEQLLKNYTTKIVVKEADPFDDSTRQPYMTNKEALLCEAHLKRSLELIVAEVFSKKIESMKLKKSTEIPDSLQVRWVTTTFPWTTPSWEIEVWWNNDWLEICGCGVVKEQVLRNAGYKADSKIGWAFGLGLDRIAMLLFEIPDIRLLWTKDERFHKQFKKGEITTFKPYSKYPGTLRDVAFWLPDTSEKFKEIHENDIMEIVRNIAGDLVESVKLTDEFLHPKTHRKSLCYRINYQSMDRNITNAEINDLQNKVNHELVSKYGVELR